MLQTDNNSRLFFVGGIFGSGKSTLCQTLGRMLPARHLKASDLIRYVPRPDDTTGKAVPEVLDNQERLIAALAAQGRRDGVTLLDGHFCLLDDSHTIVKLPIDVFRRIGPNALLVIESDFAEIAARIKQRDEKEMEPSLIQALSQAERQHASDVGQALNIPVKLVHSSTAIGEALAFLSSIPTGSSYAGPS